MIMTFLIFVFIYVVIKAGAGANGKFFQWIWSCRGKQSIFIPIYVMFLS